MASSVQVSSELAAADESFQFMAMSSHWFIIFACRVKQCLVYYIRLPSQAVPGLTVRRVKRVPKSIYAEAVRLSACYVKAERPHLSSKVKFTRLSGCLISRPPSYGLYNLCCNVKQRVDIKVQVIKVCLYRLTKKYQYLR